MASLIQELENNEALLLMFLTDELPVEDRAEVDQMLLNDANLRAELVQIQSAYDGAIVALSRLDQDRSAIPAENHAIRQAMRAMKQWQVDRLSRQPVLIETPRSRISFWMYPSAAAAALLIGTISWWGFGGEPAASKTSTDGSAMVGPGTELAQVTPPTPEDIAANRLDVSLRNDVPAVEQPNGLADAEIQANSLADRSDSSWVASPLFLTEANP